MSNATSLVVKFSVLDLVRDREVGAEKLRQQTRLFRHWEAEAREHWEKLTQKQQDFLKWMVYAGMESPGPDLFSKLSLRFRDIPKVLNMALQVFYVGFRAGFGGQNRLFADFFTAKDQLQQAVLDAIENEHPNHQKRVAQAVDSYHKQSDEERVKTRAEFDEWLSS